MTVVKVFSIFRFFLMLKFHHTEGLLILNIIIRLLINLFAPPTEINLTTNFTSHLNCTILLNQQHEHDTVWPWHEFDYFQQGLTSYVYSKVQCETALSSDS